MKTKSVLVIGGGFFGMFIAEHLALQGHQVRLIEKGDDFMQRASYVNQARVHNGYHYPRSILTALRSRISYPRFTNEFRDCIDDQFEKYYLVGSLLGKVSARQFHQFCERIGASCEPAPTRISRLINPQLIEAVYRVTECAFDSQKIKLQMIERLRQAGVQWRLQCTVEHVRQDTSGGLKVQMSTIDDGQWVEPGFDHVFNCTYANINSINHQSQQAIIPLKHEMAEMCLVNVPDELRRIGLTVMCGPFFSLMPFPSANCHSFSHVRYTPHHDWQDSPHKATQPRCSQQQSAIKSHRTAWGAMWRDAARYLPILADCQYVQSLWEVKTILPRSESDDSRPILFKVNHGLNGFHCVMGGKIDNVYDAVAQIDKLNLMDQQA